MLSPSNMTPEAVAALEIIVRTTLSKAQDMKCVGRNIIDTKSERRQMNWDLVISSGISHSFGYVEYFFVTVFDLIDTFLRSVGEIGLFMTTDIVRTITVDTIPLNVYLEMRVRSYYPRSASRVSLYELFFDKKHQEVKRKLLRELKSLSFVLPHLRGTRKKKMHSLSEQTAR